MVFSSLIFLFSFLPIFLLFYFLVPFKFKNLVLFLFSLVFYAWGEPIYILLMLFSTLFDYINGLLIEKFGVRSIKSKYILLLSMVGNLGLLFIFKYLDFFIGSFNLLNLSSIPLFNLALPIGISFYTFQTMSYTIDVYRGVVPAQHNLISLGAYVSMFPQLIAGPIVQFKTVSDELILRTHSLDNVYIGLRRFIIGLSKKVLLANNIGFIWTTILKDYQISSLSTLWLGVFCFSLQIYYDFSGYSDMAIGLGKMLGFNFLENFNYPYISSSVTDFWRRWHISLGTWFREYVYIPLGGNKKGLCYQIRNISIVWLLTGIWHGASWNYLLWGCYYGLLLIFEKVFLLKFLEKLPKLLRHLYTIFIILIGWVIFAIEDFTILKNYLFSLFYNSTLIDNTFLYLLSTNFVLLIVSILCSLGLFNHFYLTFIKYKSPVIVSILDIFLILLFIISISFLVNSTYNPFLYFRF